MRQSNVPLDLKKGPDLPNNQPKSLSNARRKIRRKRKRKEKFSSEKPVLVDDELAKSRKKQQSNVPFPLEKRPVDFQIRAVFTAMKKYNKERGVCEWHVLCKLQCLLTHYLVPPLHHHHGCFFSDLQPNRFPKGVPTRYQVPWSTLDSYQVQYRPYVCGNSFSLWRAMFFYSPTIHFTVDGVRECC